MRTKLCCIFNTPSLYRENIYKRIDNEYDCDWFFEDTNNHLKEFNTSVLNHVKRLHTSSIGPFYFVVGMLSLLREDKYDRYLMMGHSRNLSTFFFLILKKVFYPQKRVYLWTHGFYGKESFLERVWKKILLTSADEVFLYGDYARNLMIEKHGFKAEKLHAIHNSLDYDTQLSLRKVIKPSDVYRNHFKNNNPVIVFIGRLTKIKKIEMVIQAVADLKMKGYDYNLCLVGDGPELSDLASFADTLKVKEQIWFYGACYDEKRNADFIYNADICVSPGNIGLTSVHMLMFGCPAITHMDFAHQMPEFEVIREGKTGTFFERDNQESLDSAIIGWFSKKNYNRESIRRACFDEIDANWNPNYQMDVLTSIIS